MTQTHHKKNVKLVSFHELHCGRKLGQATNNQNCSFHLGSGPWQQLGRPVQNLNKRDRLEWDRSKPLRREDQTKENIS